jgi:hypothetical protein
MPVRENGGGKEKEERGKEGSERFGGHDGDGERSIWKVEQNLWRCSGTEGTLRERGMP